jgi:hypothetical protein
MYRKFQKRNSFILWQCGSSIIWKYRSCWRQIGTFWKDPHANVCRQVISWSRESTYMHWRRVVEAILGSGPVFSKYKFRVTMICDRSPSFTPWVIYATDAWLLVPHLRVALSLLQIFSPPDSWSLKSSFSPSITMALLFILLPLVQLAKTVCPCNIKCWTESYSNFRSWWV